MNPSEETITDSEAVIIPPQLAVRAMRDSGYRNTAHALSELIDNSVQADAQHVEVICIEERQQINERQVKRIKSIGVLDNGSGMSPVILQHALQFGNGTHLGDRSGIGRFGMGLPNSSISQCRRVEAWTWENGPDNAMYTYLDVDEIEKGSLTTVPIPKHQALPSTWRNKSKIVASTGTLVLWSNFDQYRLTWRGASATLRNTGTLVGRVHRKFIDDGRLSIKLIAIEGESKTFDEYVKVNDPLYLMKNSSTPEPFDKKPMFQKWGENDEIFTIEHENKEHKVTTRMSWAREKTITEDGSDRGAKPYGKHAAKNLGISIVRAGRELDLDRGWANSYDPTERWWGVEVEFPPTLDEVFGVTNNKQSATTFSGMSQFNWKDEAESGESYQEFCERIKSEGDPRALLLPVIDHIRRQIGEVRKRLGDQTKGSRVGAKNNRHDVHGAADRATTKFRERAEQGHKTEFDDQEFTQEDRDVFEQDLITDKHYSKNVAQDTANAVLKRNRKVEFLTKSMDGYAFFNVEHHHGGLTAIVFNTNHPFHDHLMETLEPNIDTEGETDADLMARINRATDTLKLVFAAWARYEMEEVHQQENLSDMRQEWGKMARFILTEEEEEKQK